jgi:hypothetical protein
MKTKSVYKKKKIDKSMWAHIETGQFLSSYEPSLSSVNVINKDLKIVESIEFICIDSLALRYIQSIFNKADMEKILRMSDMVQGPYNFLSSKVGDPHTSQTLRAQLEYDESEFCRFMKRLHTKSVIYYLMGYMNGRKVKRIMLNPTLARKCRMFNKECLEAFDDLSQKRIKIKTLHYPVLRAA